MQQIWPEEFAETSSHRFRGENDAKEIQVSFMLAHYVMERQRETQLASYWTYRLDANQDGVLSWTEREHLINKIDRYHHRVESRTMSSTFPQKLSIYNSFLDGHKELLDQADLPLSGSTTYQLSGLDGYPFGMPISNTSESVNQSFKRPFLFSHNDRTCVFDIDFCLGSEFRNRTTTVSASTGKGSIFERMAFKEFHCGDCLLYILRENEDNGSKMEEASPGLMNTIIPLDRASDAFAKVTVELAQYNYVIGVSDTTFLQLQSLVPAQRQLKRLLAERNKKLFFCINDDVENNPLIVRKVKDEFSKFLQTRFPVASPWEV